MPDSDSALYLRIGLGVVCLITLFVPGTSFLLGIAGHVGLLFTAHNPTSQEIIGVIFGGMLLIGFVGYFVIASGIIPLQPE